MADNIQTVSTRSTLGLSTVLFLIFLVLRLTGNIDWAWYWVASPLWIGWGIGALFFFVFAMIIMIAS